MFLYILYNFITKAYFVKDAPSEGEEEISHENTDLNEVKTEVSEDAEESKQSDVESHQPPVQEDKIQTQGCT